MDLFKYLAKNWFNLIGGLFLGLSLPFGHPLISKEYDIAIFAPLGLIFLGISAYYMFINKK